MRAVHDVLRGLLSRRHTPRDDDRRGEGRRPRRIHVAALPLARRQGHVLPHPGLCRRLHGLRLVRRRLPRSCADHEAPGHTARRTGAPARIRADHPLQGVAHARHLVPGNTVAPAAHGVLRRLRRLRRDALREDAHTALRRQSRHRQRHGLLLNLGRQLPQQRLLRQQPRPRPGMGQLALRGQRRIRLRHRQRLRTPPPSLPPQRPLRSPTPSRLGSRLTPTQPRRSPPHKPL